MDTQEVLEGLSETNREPSPDLDESGTESETSEFLIVTDDTGSESESENEDRSTITSSEHKVMMSKIKVGVYVIVNYEGELFPGIVSQSGKNKPISKGVIEVSTTKRVIGIHDSNFNCWKWPQPKDQIAYDISEIIMIMPEPPGIVKMIIVEKILSHNHYGVYLLFFFIFVLVYYTIAI